MRFLFLTFALFLASCGANEPNHTATDVTISLGQSVASGAIGTQGSIPANIQSFSLVALNASGKIIAGPVVANRPNFTLKIRVPNGNGIRFRILAFAQANATGIILYETLSAPVNLKGKPVTVPVKMNLSVKIAADKTSTFRGGLVNLIGKVSGNTPNASSPLLWAKTGGTLANTDPYGATNTWTAPATLGSYTIAAHIDPYVNPDQDPTVKGSVDVLVVNRTPIISLSAATLTASVGILNTDVYAIASDPDGDTLSFALAPATPSWISIHPTSGVITLTPPASAAGQTFTLAIGVADAFGSKASVNLNINIVGIPVVDQTAPVITLNGANPITVAQGAAYTDAGSTVTDNVDTGLIATVTGTVNTAVVGTYTLTYNASDAAGNAATPVTRTVNVASVNLQVNVQDIYAAAVPNVEVWAYDPYTSQFIQAGTTDVYGQLSVNLPNTLYYFGVETKNQAYASGFYTPTAVSGANIGIDAGDPIPVNPHALANLTLIVEPGLTVSGTIIDAANIAVPNAIVRFSNASNSGIQNGSSWHTVTDPYGNYTTGVKAGSYHVFADAMTRDPSGREIALPANGGGYFTGISGSIVTSDIAQANVMTPPFTYNAQLQAGALVSGSVTDSYGLAVSGLDIIIDLYNNTSSNFFPTSFIATTDPYGAYSIALPASSPGEYYVLRANNMIWDNVTMTPQPLPNTDIGGYASTLTTNEVVQTPFDPYTRSIVVAAVDQTAINLKLAKGASFSGNITDAYGSVGNVGVWISGINLTQGIYFTKTNSAGNYKINVPPGDYEITVDSFIDNGTTIAALANFAVGGFVDTYGNISVTPVSPQTVVSGQSKVVNIN
ncbi:MAG TPA: DUF5011 domain-containing protein, partial [Mariprofundaceae bacterium]|nr:DUF5011 domain-containing protein [Mariprofundaceae bacterium]